MSEPEDAARRQAPGRSTPTGRSRARILLPIGFVVALVLLFLFIYLVSRTSA